MEPTARLLLPPYPNPFRASTRIPGTTTGPGLVTAHIVDIRGSLVRTLFRGERGKGPFELVWDGRTDGGLPAPAGTYWIRVQTAGEGMTRRLVKLP